MDFPSKALEEVVDHFAKLPGIGKKTALRLALHVLKMEDHQVGSFSKSLDRLKTHLHYCEQCYNVSDNNTCSICLDMNRDRTRVCVVEDLRDVIAIENTHQFRGLYHVLGGLISPVDGVGPEELNIRQLILRLVENPVEELIFALAATMEGDTTAFYISRQLREHEITISTLAKGIAIGGELEYADEITLGRSITGRIPYKL